MEIQELWRVIRQRWRVVVAVTLICVCLSLAWSLAGPVSYRAQGRVIISTSASLGTAYDAYNGEQVSVERAPTYAHFLRGPEVAARASKTLRGVISAQTIRNSIDARINSRQPMIIITATSPRASDAVQIVSAAELGLQQYVFEIERPGHDGSMTWVVLSGDIPTVARVGNPVRDAVLAALAGIVLGTLLAVYRDRTDPIVKSGGQLAGTGVTYRGTIMADDELSRLREGFRRLAVGCALTGEPDTDILGMDVDGRLIRFSGTGRILVVGVDPDCDALFIAQGLAGGLVGCGRKVTLIDAVSGQSLGGTGGLSDVVEGSRGWAECRTRTGSDQLWQMDIGTKGNSLPALLIDGKDTKRRLALSDAQEHAVIAAPSIVHSSLAVALTCVADASLIVVRPGKSQVADVVEAKMTLVAMGVPLIGMVLLTGQVSDERAEHLLGDRADALICPNGEVNPSANTERI
jgi:capsular polysaccharide biosynthesis protein/Mrp family chromosome partitioning ATPase